MPYRDVLDEHRRRLSRLAERRGAAQLKKMYDETQAALERQLRDVARRASDSFSSHQLRVFLAQIRQGQTLLAKRMAGELGDISLEAQTEALRGLTKDINRLEKQFGGGAVSLPIEEAARFRGVIHGRRESMLRSHETSMANYSATVVTDMEDSMSLSLATGRSTSEAIDQVMDVADLNWWRAERIVRTETAFAFNATQYDGIREVAVELDDMMLRWVEYVDDESYEPLDDRVGDDSVAMHGQIVRPGGQFVFPSVMPDGLPVPHSVDSLIGQSWAFPPNRPNDRATLAPWRPHWGIPAWRWSAGGRVDAV